MDSYNDTSDQEWLPKPPLILPYKPVFVGPANYDSTTSNRTWSHDSFSFDDLIGLIHVSCLLVYLMVDSYTWCNRNSCWTGLHLFGRIDRLGDLFMQDASAQQASPILARR